MLFLWRRHTTGVNIDMVLIRTQCHWIHELYRRMRLPVFDGVQEALQIYNVERNRRLAEIKTNEHKTRKVQSKIKREPTARSSVSSITLPLSCSRILIQFCLFFRSLSPAVFLQRVLGASTRSVRVILDRQRQVVPGSAFSCADWRRI